MRKVEVFKYIHAFGKPKEMVSMGEALFHQWGTDFEEFEAGPGNMSVAIVEFPDGTVIGVHPERIKFLPGPTMESFAAPFGSSGLKTYEQCPVPFVLENPDNAHALNDDEVSLLNRMYELLSFDMEYVALEARELTMLMGIVDSEATHKKSIVDLIPPPAPEAVKTEKYPLDPDDDIPF